ncbi:MAG TPA: hypothetical protein IAC12_03660 [Candidatus Aphodovivens avistercoris]|nr:hypothetical protein [Candidatus Aphodovivens avistercoris]
MTIDQLNKILTWTPSLASAVSTDATAKNLAREFGLGWTRVDGRVVVECEDGMAEVAWANRKRTMQRVREAEAPGR